MDPYLEAPQRWPDVHLRLINNISVDLQPQLLPRYVATAEERVLLEPLDEAFIPDLAVREYAGVQASAALRAPREATPAEIIDVPEWTSPHRFVTIRELEGGKVVTVIEVLSPANKTGSGRDAYRRKQEELLVSDANLVEIDLLRGGRHTIAVPQALISPSDYRVCVHRARSGACEVLRFGLRDPLPPVSIPLKPYDEDVILSLETVVQQCYEQGAYAFRQVYKTEPDPPIRDEDAAWARERLADWHAESRPG
jgi:hypothetical protein